MSLSTCSAQTQANLDALDAHFVGVWIGENHDYRKTPAVTTPLRLVITEDAKKHVLHMDYFYGEQGKDHYVRLMAFKPESSTVDLRWKGSKQEHYKALGLTRLLETGFGDLTLIPMPDEGNSDADESRFVLHLEATVLTYAWQTSSDGEDFTDAGSWSLKRVAP